MTLSGFAESIVKKIPIVMSYDDDDYLLQCQYSETTCRQSLANGDELHNYGGQIPDRNSHKCNLTPRAFHMTPCTERCVHIVGIAYQSFPYELNKKKGRF